MSARFPDVSLSVVIPAYNEEQNIEKTVDRAVATLCRMVGRFEILLIDDCSQDRTPELAERLGREISQVRTFHNPRNLRQGATLRAGFRRARFELVTHNAMDYPFDFEDLPALLEHFPGVDIAIASRRSYSGVSQGRQFVSSVNRALLRSLFGLSIVDYNFIQIYRREIVQGVPGFSRATPFVTVLLTSQWVEVMVGASTGGAPSGSLSG